MLTSTSSELGAPSYRMTASAEALDVALVEPTDWGRLLADFPTRTVFHGTAWLGATAAAYGLRPLLVSIRREGQLAGVWPLLECRKGPFRVLGSPLRGWATVYMGPLFGSLARPGDVVAAVFEKLRLHRCAYCYVKVMDAVSPVDLSRTGFRRLQRYRTYLLDLDRCDDALWEGLEGRSRTEVRKARKNGLSVSEDMDASFVNDFWNMSVEVFRRSGIQPTFSRRMLEEVCTRLAASDELITLSAFKDGRRVAALVLPHDHRCVYYWAGASVTEARKLGANPYLIWEAIQAARRKNLRTFDFVSIYGGPGKFKRSFGPQVHATATHWERYGSPAMRLAKRAYERFLQWKRRTR